MLRGRAAVLATIAWSRVAGKVVDLWRNEPARVRAFIAAVLAALVTAGFSLPVEAILAVVTALLGLGEVTRRAVVPVAKAETRELRSYVVGIEDGVKAQRAVRRLAEKEKQASVT